MRARLPSSVAIALVAILSVARVADSQTGELTLTEARHDRRLLYIYESTGRIDWPLISHLQDVEGFAPTLIQVIPKATLTISADRGVDRATRGILTLPAVAPVYFDSAFALLFAERPPDIIILGEPSGSLLYEGLVAHLRSKLPIGDSIFGVAKVFREVFSDDTSATLVAAFNRRELEKRSGRWSAVGEEHSQRGSETIAETALLGRYQLLYSSRPVQGIVSFSHGVPALRLERILEGRLTAGPMRTSLLRRAESYTRNIELSASAVGRERATLVANAYKDLLFISKDRPVLSAFSTDPQLRAYFADRLRAAEVATLEAVGIDWDGSVVIRESPEGRKVKFRALLSANGPLGASLRALRFRPYWSDTTIALDSIVRTVDPHRSFIREYILPVPSDSLSINRPESLRVTAVIEYAGIEMEMETVEPIWVEPTVSVRFTPDFVFLPSGARSDIDLVAQSAYLRIEVTKPSRQTGRATVQLETPDGMFAGAYRQAIDLGGDRTVEHIQIPFSLSKLFQLGINRATVTLALDGRKLASDTVSVRIAECAIPSKRKIALLPDSAGLIEDILRMTEGSWQPLTDRMLTTADLEQFNTLVIGSGALRTYPSLPRVRDRLEEFVRNGGTILLFTQPGGIPPNMLPVSFVQAPLFVDRDAIQVRLPDGKLLSTPYPITHSELLVPFAQRTLLPAAVVSPAEIIIAGPAGEGLLSVSRFGNGSIIFCAIPLPDMVRSLQIDAIHLLANLMNY